jgi:hypothetical protein
MQDFSSPPSGLAHFRESVVLTAFSPIGGPPFFRPSPLPAFALFVEALPAVQISNDRFWRKADVVPRRCITIARIGCCEPPQPPIPAIPAKVIGRVAFAFTDALY